MVRLDPVDQLHALGDLHGDYGRFVKLLAQQGFIAEPLPRPKFISDGVNAPQVDFGKDVLWTGGDRNFVLLGDLINKGKQSLATLVLVMKLQEQAKTAGGDLRVVMGNHEQALLSGNVPERLQHELIKAGFDVADTVTGRNEIGQWMRDLPWLLIYGDDLAITHAGNTFGLSAKTLDSAIAAGVFRDGFTSEVVAHPDSIVNARLSPKPWTKKVEPKSRETVELVTSELGVDALVQGHQPGAVNFGKGVTREAHEPFVYADKLVLTDVGLSRAVTPGEAEPELAMFRFDRDDEDAKMKTSVAGAEGEFFPVPSQG
ncbi:MAG: metallophosphoesterase [Myxococcaceae bacterium]